MELTDRNSASRGATGVRKTMPLGWLLAESRPHVVRSMESWIRVANSEVQMIGYKEISSQEDMEVLLNKMAGFHDSLTKEFHIINRAYVLPDHCMVMGFRFDGQLLVQSQLPPYALELVCSNILELHINSPEGYWSAGGKVRIIGRSVEKAVELNFDKAMKIVTERLFYCERSDWLGHRAFLGSEVPSVDAVAASKIEGKWRQCSVCSDAWEEEDRICFSLCPGCGRLTECPSA